MLALRGGGQPLLRDRRSVALGLSIGLLGAGGQLVLFKAVQVGPPYLIFPIISLSPALTIAMSFALLKERTGRLGVLGIVLALLSLPLFDYRATGEPTGYGAWLPMALLVMAAWGGQAYIIKLANASMDSASIFFYMMLGGLLVVPLALLMTDFSQPINYSLDGVGLAAVIQSLNAIGALTLVLALRRGKAIIVSPLVNAGAPLLTAVISLALTGVMPGPLKLAGHRAGARRGTAARVAVRGARCKREGAARYRGAAQAGRAASACIRCARRIRRSSNARCVKRRHAMRRCSSRRPRIR